MAAYKMKVKTKGRHQDLSTFWKRIHCKEFLSYVTCSSVLSVKVLSKTYKVHTANGGKPKCQANGCVQEDK